MSRQGGPEAWEMWGEMRERFGRLEAYVGHLVRQRDEQMHHLNRRQDDMRREMLEHLGHLERRLSMVKPNKEGFDLLAFLKRAPWRLVGWGIQLIAATGLGWYMPQWLKLLIAHF